ncbi:hypothetical protein B0T17DRAFT_482134 [Bombardia bombarda]|uniref:Uncharacterized protein n=1 Tax=Bombardia bombarda TaxID=252184 RepID=A0AA40CEA4_9PEZI|nr:hypothetical protein B0T17DRAFT_482134 [Bombardia bombarda]
MRAVRAAIPGPSGGRWPLVQLGLELVNRRYHHHSRPNGAPLAILSLSRQWRFQSTSGPTDKKNNNISKSPNASQKGSRPPPPPPPPFSWKDIRRLVGHAILGGFRTLRGSNLRKLYQQNPEELVLGLVAVLCSVALAVYVVQVYFTYFYAEQFTRYPDPVAKALRRALYYSNYAPDPQLALKYYKRALELCDELRLDPFSDDVMGIKIQLAAWLEHVDNYDNAARVLETLLGDCKRWVEVMERSVREGTVPPGLMPPPPPSPPSPDKETGGGEQQQAGEEAVVPAETIWAKRTRVLGKAVGISVKLADLYADEHLVKPELAHERLVWAVETALKELRRRAVEGLKDGEGDWMSAEQIGGTLESLGHSYEAKSQFHLALPLFFQALRLCQEPCHSAVLMNNIATCFAQHQVMGPGETALESLVMGGESSSSSSSSATPKSMTPAQRRTSYLEAAHRWASNAHQHATEPQGEKRTQECDEACAVSLCNLADIAGLSGNMAEARRRFDQAIEMSRNLGFGPGITQAEAGLKALSASV